VPPGHAAGAAAAAGVAALTPRGAHTDAALACAAAGATLCAASMTVARTYDSATANRGVLAHVGSILRFPALVARNRYMVHNFLRRDILGRVSGSFLGVGWLLLQPIFLFVVYYAVFGVLFADRNVGAEDPDVYAVYLFSGILVWQAFAEATSTSCGVIVDNGSLVKKVSFPSEVLLVHVQVSAMFTYLVGAAVCCAIAWPLGIARPTWLLAALPLVMAVQMAMTLGIGFLLANLYVFVRDLVQLWRILIMAWMFLTPVFWQPALLHRQLPADVVPWVVNLNPVYPLMQAHRIALGGSQDYLGEFWPQLGVAAVWAVALLVIGNAVFMSRKHKFADLI
jgi:ABC-type polysaccharide/polyol phosphate export permease